MESGYARTAEERFVENFMCYAEKAPRKIQSDQHDT